MEKSVRLALLNKPLWSLQDIKNYCECGIGRASKIMQAAKKISVSRFLPSKAKRDNVFEVLGLNIKSELANLIMTNEVSENAKDGK